MINKKPSDILFEDHILYELLLDLLDYGIKINPFKQPITETWMNNWKEDFRFRNFIEHRQKKTKPGRSVLIDSIRKTKESKKGFHMELRKKRKKIFYKI